MTIVERQKDAEEFAIAEAHRKDCYSKLSSAQAAFEKAQKVEQQYAANLCNTVGANVSTRIFKVTDGVVLVQWRTPTFTSVVFQSLEPSK